MTDFETTVRLMLNEFYQGSEQQPEHIVNAARMFVDDMEVLFHPSLLASQPTPFLLNVFRAWAPIAQQCLGMPKERIEALAKNFTLFLKFNSSVEVAQVTPQTNVVSIFGKTVH